MSDEPKQGRLANSAGSTLENTVIGTLTLAVTQPFDTPYYSTRLYFLISFHLLSI